ncbi:hypothetical protein Hanom_Chr15g01394311 [Helianthus anomalus]
MHGHTLPKTVTCILADYYTCAYAVVEPELFSRMVIIKFFSLSLTARGLTHVFLKKRLRFTYKNLRNSGD